MSRRRRLLQAFSAAALLPGAPLLRAQAARARRVGILLATARSAEILVPPFRKRMSALGWDEGRNLTIETRVTENRYDRVPVLAAELVRIKVDVIVTVSTPMARAAKDATATIPVVFAWVADPVAAGLVASLAHPGGNLTGVSNQAIEIAPKQFELLKALLPGLARVAELRDPKWEGAQALSDRFRDAAARAAVTLVTVEASSAAELEGAFSAAARQRATAMVIPPIPLFGTQGVRIAQLGKQYRIAIAAQARSFVTDGGLVSYGSDNTDGFARTAAYVDKILRGAKPADLPVEQADRFETIVNRATANSLGLTIPPSVLIRADEVIE
jgi:putative ABC transport system substrate-binding protein